MIDRLAPAQHDTIDDVPEPAENAVLVGHDEVRAALAASYKAGQLHHALMLAGPEGIGKATLAFHLAWHLLRYPDPATAPDMVGNPDPASPLFRAIAQGAHPSVLHLTRPANDRTKGFKTAVTVDEIRKVGRFLGMSAHDGGYRVVIVDPADDMNTNAANALLKNLEEPPRKTIFVLVAHMPGRLLPTIRSRCRMIRLSPLDTPQLGEALKLLGVEVADEDVLHQAGGSVRKALLQGLYGGAEIAAAVHDGIAARRFDFAHVSRLADAVTQRDQPLQYQIFNEHLLGQLAERAHEAAGQGQSARAAQLATLWSETRRAMQEAEAYNLDKRQQVMMLMMAAHEALHAA